MVGSDSAEPFRVQQFRWKQQNEGGMQWGRGWEPNRKIQWHGEKVTFLSLNFAFILPPAKKPVWLKCFAWLASHWGPTCDEHRSPPVYVVGCPPPCWQNPANGWVIGPLWASAPSLPEACPLHTYTLRCILNESRGYAALSANITRLPYPKLVLGTPVEIPDGAGQFVAVVAWLEAISLGQDKWQTEKKTTRWAMTYQTTIVAENKVVRRRQTAPGNRQMFLCFSSQALCL